MVFLVNILLFLPLFDFIFILYGTMPVSIEGKGGICVNFSIDQRSGMYYMAAQWMPNESLVVWRFVSCDTSKIQLLNLRVLECRCSSYSTTTCRGATARMVACADIRTHVALYLQ